MCEKLTNSRISSFKSCRKKSWFEYEIGLRREVDPKALRMGSAYHDGLEIIGKGGSLFDSLSAIQLDYAIAPDNFDALQWDYEEETLLALFESYCNYWQRNQLEHIATEQTFSIPLCNPETGKPTPLFTLDGKIDGIVKLEDGRLAVMEHKLLGDIHSQSMWQRLQIDHQITLYILAARQLGYDVDCVLYNVTQKPTIKPNPVPVLDDNGYRIVLDLNGNRALTKTDKPRQTSDTAKGYTLQTVPMTPDEWHNKLLDDIASRPEHYFIRNEIPRLDQDIREYERELWDIQQTIREAQRNDKWYRTCGFDTCKYCSYFDLCVTGWSQGDSIPEGFVSVDNVHPELN